MDNRAYIRKAGISKNGQKWALAINAKNIKTSTDKEFIEYLIEMFNTNQMTIDEIKKSGKKPYDLDKAYIGKSGISYKGNQKWAIVINGKRIRTSINKEFIEYLIEMFNTNQMTIDQITVCKEKKIYDTDKAYLAKAGKSNGQQAWSIKIRKKMIRRNLDKSFLQDLVNLFNNNQINIEELKTYHICQYCGNVFYTKKQQKFCSEECYSQYRKEYHQKRHREMMNQKKERMKEYRQYGVLKLLLTPRAYIIKGGMSNGQQSWGLMCDKKLVRRSIDKSFLERLMLSLNSYEMTFEEAKNKRQLPLIIENFKFNDKDSKLGDLKNKSLDEIYDICGIYYILNLINGKIYIGESTKIGSRWYEEHIQQLEANRHENRYLQFAWNKYGSGNFELGILQLCDEEDRFISEQCWIAFFESNLNQYGYNLTLGGENPPVRYGEDNNRYRKDVWVNEEKICSLYKKGFSVKKLSDMFQASGHIINEILEKNTLPRRNRGETAIINIILNNGLLNINDFTLVDVYTLPRMIKNRKGYVFKIGDKNILSSYDKNFIEDCIVKYFNGTYTLEDLKHFKNLTISSKSNSLWPIQKVSYKKYKMYVNNREPNPCLCFFLKYKGKLVIGNGFMDFYTPELIHDLIREYSE